MCQNQIPNSTFKFLIIIKYFYVHLYLLQADISNTATSLSQHAFLITNGVYKQGSAFGALVRTPEPHGSVSVLQVFSDQPSFLKKRQEASHISQQWFNNFDIIHTLKSPVCPVFHFLVFSLFSVFFHRYRRLCLTHIT